MKTKSLITGALALVIGAGVVCAPANAKVQDPNAIEGKKAGKVDGQFKEKMQKFREEQKQKGEAFREQMKKENADFKQSIKDKTPAEKIAALITQCEKNYTAKKQFRLDQFTQRIEFTRSLLTEKGAPAEKQTQILARMEAAKEKAVAHFDQQHKENIEFLNSLANDKNLDDKQLKEKMKAHREQQKAENKQFKDQMKTERKAAKAQFHGKNKTDKGPQAETQGNG